MQEGNWSPTAARQTAPDVYAKLLTRRAFSRTKPQKPRPPRDKVEPKREESPPNRFGGARSHDLLLTTGGRSNGTYGGWQVGRGILSRDGGWKGVWSRLPYPHPHIPPTSSDPRQTAAGLSTLDMSAINSRMAGVGRAGPTLRTIMSLAARACTVSDMRAVIGV